MDTSAVKYAVLRDQREWDGVTLAGLEKRDDGALALARVPAPYDGQPISSPAPFEVDPSGIAVGRSDDLYVSDTANNVVVFIDEICNARYVLPGGNAAGSALGQFNAPLGLLAGRSGLYVADSGNGRIQVFRLPTLELHAVWDQLFQNPTCLAADSEDRIYILDRGMPPTQPPRVMRFDAWGRPDDPYNTAMAQQTALASPFSLAVGAQDTLYVSDDQSDSVPAFDPTGKLVATLPQINLASPAKPRMLAAHRHSLYVADSGSGLIWLYNSATKTYLGTAANFRGPVSAMAADPAGAALYVKTALDQTFFKLKANSAFISFGTLTTGPLDAGEDSEWERVRVQAQIPASTNVQLFTYVSDNSASGPGPNDWQLAPCLDILVPPLPGDPNGKPGQKRYLWIQVQLTSASISATATLLQVQAQTTAESYLDHLPAIYRKKDLPRRFLERWLALFRSELGDLELLVQEMPRLFDPLTTPDEDLDWLATWLAFEFPAGQDAPEKRRLLARIHELYKRRGTPYGIREFIQLYARAKAHLFEAFRERRVWQLGIQSALGFDTGLAPSAPNGMIVGGLAPADPKYLGLQGEYYCGPNFDTSMMTRTDPTIDFKWENEWPSPSMRRCRGSVLSVAWNVVLLSTLPTIVLATGNEDHTARIWDIATRNVALILSGHSDAVTSVAWRPNGTQLATGSADKTAKLWDVPTVTLSGHSDAVTSVAWSPDGTKLATGSADRTARVWDVATANVLSTLSGHGDAVTSVAWSLDGTKLATGSADRTAKLWDVATANVLSTLSGHGDAVTSVAWSPDGTQLATGSADQTAKLWDVATAKVLSTLSGHNDAVTSVAWRASGRQLATGSKDTTAKVWIATTGNDWVEWLTLATPVSFSVRWTGQIQPRYSERYTFHILSADGARLWIDDEPVIDNWKSPQKNEVGGSIALTAGRWYSIKLEYYKSDSVSNGPAEVHLYWSSRSQQKEIVPQSRLYSILDETANLDVPPQISGCETLLVGQTVVGQSGPLPASQFGTPLFSDTAHLFTVSIAASRVPKLSQKQELRRIVEAEKPAHTDFHLCFVEPRMRVGFQARIGVDSIVAGPPEPVPLGRSWLGLDSVLGADPGDNEIGRVGKHARIGQDTVLA